MITPSTSITSDDSTNKTVTVTPKPVNNPYQLEVHRLNVLQVALNIALDTPDAKPREHPALPSNNDTKGKAKCDDPEDDPTRPLSPSSLEDLQVAASVLDQAKLLPEAPPPNCVLPDGKTDWVAMLSHNSQIKNRLPSTQTVALIVELQSSMQTATANTRQWTERLDFHNKRDATWIPSSYKINVNKLNIHFSDLLQGTTKADEITREAVIGRDAFIALGRTLIGRTIAAEREASINARLTLFCKQLLSMQYAFYENLRCSTEFSGQLNTADLGKNYLPSLLQLAVISYLQYEVRPYFLEYLLVESHQALAIHFVSHACPPGTTVADIEGVEATLNISERTMLVLLQQDLKNYAYNSTVYTDYLIRVELSSKANDAAVIANKEANAIKAATEATAIAISAQSAGDASDLLSESNKLISKSEAATIRKKLAAYEANAAKTLATINSDLKGKGAGKKTRGNKNTKPAPSHANNRKHQPAKSAKKWGKQPRKSTPKVSKSPESKTPRNNQQAADSKRKNESRKPNKPNDSKDSNKKRPVSKTKAETKVRFHPKTKGADNVK